MKIPTNAGEIDLTAEMVCRGMVFDTEIGPQTIREIGSLGWCNGGVLGPRDLRAFLGCDPSLATRPDCERYGIAPGCDAGAHGFARLRGGGAVDFLLWRVPGDVWEHPDGGRETSVLGRPWPGAPSRFIGLDARHARPGDVRRLCCGSTNRADQCTLAIRHDGDHEDLGTGARWADPHHEKANPGRFTGCFTGDQGSSQAPGRPARPSCPVVPGPMGPLDKIAARYGLERSAEETDEALRERTWKAFMRTDDAPMVTCDRCADPVVPPEHGFALQVLALDGEKKWRQGTLCERCGKRGEELVWRGNVLVSKGTADVLILRRTVSTPDLPTRLVFCGRDGDDALVDLATLTNDGAFSCACGSADPAEHREGCKLPWQYRMAATWAVHFTNARGEGLSRAVQEGLFAAVAVALLAWCCRLWDASPAGQLAARDAAVAKALADVPEGCSAVGWRAVVCRIFGHYWEMAGRDEQARRSALHVAANEARDVRPAISAYGKARLFRYTPAEALARCMEPDEMTIAIREAYEAYEAGR